MVEAIFRQRGQARQERIDTWLTRTTPPRNWKDKYEEKMSNTLDQKDGGGLGGRIQDPE